MDANAIVIDPQVPDDVRRLLLKAPPDRLVPFSAQPPSVVPAVRKRRSPVGTPEGRRAAKTSVTFVVFFVATLTAWVLCAAAVSPITREVTAAAGILLAVGLINRFVALAPALEAVRLAGWRENRALTADPAHPAWEGMHAVTAHHRKYVSPVADMDADARAMWAWAVAAANALEESDVVRQGLVDSVQVTTVLPYHLWEIAERLARLSGLRAQHEAILHGVDPDDPAVAMLLAPQRRAHELANADIEARVRRLELFASLVSQADGARRREQAVRQLATLNDSHADLLARIGQSASPDELAELMSLDVQTIVDQADEAVRQANEAGRGLVLPER